MNYIEELGPLALGTRIKNLAELMMKDMAGVYKDYGIEFEPRWFTFFQLILERKKISVTQIATELNQSHPAVVQVVNVLEKKKLLSSSKDPKDKRRHLVQLTAKGKALAKQLLPVWKDVKEVSEEILSESVPDLIDKITKVEKVLKEKSTYERMNERRMKRLADELDFIPYQEQHIEDFRSLNEDWLRSHLEISDFDRKILQDPIKEILQKKGHITLMTAGNRIIGTYVLKRINDLDCELSKFTVHRDFRALKLGEKMLSYAIEEARTMGYHTMLLFTHQKLVAATQLYYKMGFEDLNTHPGMKDETGRCSILLKLNINQ